MFDFSNYWISSKYQDNSNKLVIAKFKNETENIAIEEFVGLNSQNYSFLVDKSEHKKEKGVIRNVVKQ